MIRTILRAGDSWSPLPARLGLGTVAALHALGGCWALGMHEGPRSSAEVLSQAMRLPACMTVPTLVVLGLGSVLLVAGWATRVLATLIGLAMAAMLALAGPFTDQAAIYRACTLLLGAAAAATLVLGGGGRWSLDRLLERRPLSATPATERG